MTKVERPIPLKINLIPAVAAAEVNQNLHRHARIRSENTSLDVPAQKVKEFVLQTALVLVIKILKGYSQVTEVENNK